jgi:hypothetical protein
MTIVTGSGFRLVKHLGGRSYTLRAPTFAQAGELAAAAGPHLRPSAAVLVEETREALKRIGRADLVAAMDDFEAAEDAYRSALAAYQGDDSDESKAAIRDARARLATADRARQRAEWAVREDAGLAEMRNLAQAIDRREHLLLLSMCVLGWEGPDLPPAPEKMTPESINDALPAGDVAALGQYAMELLRPTREEAGN